MTGVVVLYIFLILSAFVFLMDQASPGMEETNMDLHKISTSFSSVLFGFVFPQRGESTIRV